jgi:hypothetical protein
VLREKQESATNLKILDTPGKPFLIEGEGGVVALVPSEEGGR